MKLVSNQGAGDLGRMNLGKRLMDIWKSKRQKIGNFDMNSQKRMEIGCARRSGRAELNIKKFASTSSEKSCSFALCIKKDKIGLNYDRYQNVFTISTEKARCLCTTISGGSKSQDGLLTRCGLSDAAHEWYQTLINRLETGVALRF